MQHGKDFPHQRHYRSTWGVIDSTPFPNFLLPTKTFELHNNNHSARTNSQWVKVRTNTHKNHALGAYIVNVYWCCPPVITINTHWAGTQLQRFFRTSLAKLPFSLLARTLHILQQFAHGRAISSSRSNNPAAIQTRKQRELFFLTMEQILASIVITPSWLPPHSASSRLPLDENGRLINHRWLLIHPCIIYKSGARSRMRG